MVSRKCDDEDRSYDRTDGYGTMSAVWLIVIYFSSAFKSGYGFDTFEGLEDRKSIRPVLKCSKGVLAQSLKALATLILCGRKTNGFNQF